MKRLYGPLHPLFSQSQGAGRTTDNFILISVPTAIITGDRSSRGYFHRPLTDAVTLRKCMYLGERQMQTPCQHQARFQSILNASWMDVYLAPIQST